MIVKRSDGYYVVSTNKGPDGKRKNLGGPYKTHREAVARLNQVEMFKTMKKQGERV